MKAIDKVINHHIIGRNLLNDDEFSELLKNKLKKTSYRKLQKQIKETTGETVALSTLHGWTHRRSEYRSPNIIVELGTVHTKLNTVIKILKSINSIDNDISAEFLKQIEKEVKRLCTN